jgi:hypothetical protein
MKIRKITSLTATLAFIMMVLTSVILFIVPQGRVAYWADWRLLGLTKTDWGNIHINLGLLFLIALFVHIYLNWKPLLSYLKGKAKQIKVFTPEFNLALVITIGFVVGSYFLVPPFGWMISLNDHFKEAGAEKYGEPPYGHAELSSLNTFTGKMKLDLAKSMKLLNESGFTVADSQMTIGAIGRKYNVPPQRIYETIKPAAITTSRKSSSSGSLPESPPPGTGNLTLADLCAKFSLNLKMVVRELKKQGIGASGELNLKKIASDNNTSPIDLYERIRNIAHN